MENKNKKNFKYVKLLLLIITIILLIFLSMRLLPLFANLGTSERSNKIQGTNCRF